MIADVLWFVLGLALAALTVAPLRRLRDPLVRRLAALYLVLAGVIYVGFAAAWGTGSWLLVELGGLGLCGVFAALGLWRHPLWLAVGWALHPGWDVGVHLLGPGVEVAPRWYAIACLSYDVLMAGWLAWRYRRG